MHPPVPRTNGLASCHRAVMTEVPDGKRSPRFAFTGEPLESEQVGFDDFRDHYPNLEKSRIQATKGDGVVFLAVDGRPAERTATPWPGPGRQDVELATVLIEVVGKDDAGVSLDLVEAAESFLRGPLSVTSES